MQKKPIKTYRYCTTADLLRYVESHKNGVPFDDIESVVVEINRRAADKHLHRIATRCGQ